MPRKSETDAFTLPPFETAELRRQLADYLNTPFKAAKGAPQRSIGDYRWGVYAFFDYDDEPIYVGQTNEKVRTRIRRHLTNQRTDAVAMSVLDPFEVFEIEVWPLPEFQDTPAQNMVARQRLNAVERAVYANALAGSKFSAVLNEKDPPPGSANTPLPKSCRGRIVSDAVFKLRSHPDLRTARRALIISRLAQVISERKVQGGLRRVLMVQAKRLEWLAERRYRALGGASIVENESETEEDDQD
jgi:hypothetical protein